MSLCQSIKLLLRRKSVREEFQSVSKLFNALPKIRVETSINTDPHSLQTHPQSHQELSSSRSETA